MPTNAVVGQSGGPTSVINSSLAGVYQACKTRGIDNIYGMKNGIAGFLNKDMVNLSVCLPTHLEIELLKRTPSAYLGSCRYKLPSFEENAEIYEKIFKILGEENIELFFYIGGNDSMDTVCKLSRYAKEVNSSVKFMGIPKTIDNDLMMTDHTPGYGSAAKYIGVVMKEIVRDSSVYGTPHITITEIMGRNSGWLTAAASLSHCEDCEGVDMIFLPEVPFNVTDFIAKTENVLRMKSSVVIAVSEGMKTPDGRYVCELSDDTRFTDAFGHKNLTGTARYLSNIIMKKLGVKSRCIELSTLQRCAGHITSRTDITEAFQVGGAAVKSALENHTGEMVGLTRLSDDPYQSTTETHDIGKIANFEKKVPLEWLNDDRTDVKPIFQRYARPLIQAELTPIYINGLPGHIHL